MMDNEWKKQLRREASARHMCKENRDALEEVKSRVEAIGLYKKTIDWALEEGYPTLETLRKHFADCELAGVYVDRHFDGEVLDSQQVYVFHNCTGTIRTGLNLDRQIIPMLYFANGCEMKVECAHRYGSATRVPLYIFGENKIDFERSADMECITFNHGVK